MSQRTERETRLAESLAKADWEIRELKKQLKEAKSKLKEIKKEPTTVGTGVSH